MTQQRTKQTTWLLSLVVLACLGLHAPQSQAQSMDDDTKEIRIWSATLTPGDNALGDHTNELGYPNVNSYWGYYRSGFVNTESITDNDFVWNGMLMAA